MTLCTAQDLVNPGCQIPQLLIHRFVHKLVCMSDTRTPTWTLGDRLRKAREQAALSVADMAEKLGVHRNTVTNYERDHDAKGAPAEIVAEWARITETDVAWLIGFQTSAPQHGDRETADEEPGRGTHRPVSEKFRSRCFATADALRPLRWAS